MLFKLKKFLIKSVSRLQIYDSGKRIWSTKGEDQEVAKKEFIESLKLLEGELGDKPYFNGDNFGFVDLALIPYYSWVPTYEKFGNFNMKDECPKFMAWANKCMHKDSVFKSLVDSNKVYEYVLKLKQHLGIA